MTDKTVPTISLWPSEPLTEGEMATVSLHLIEAETVKPTPKMLESVKRRGVMTPVILRPDDKGQRFIVVDGLRRVNASRIAGHLHIKAIILATDSVIADAITLDSNSNRSANPVAEYRAIERLMEKGATERQISEATGLAVGTIRKRLKLVTLPPEVIDMIGLGKLSISTAEAMANLSDAAIGRLASKLGEAGKLTQADVDAEKSVRKEDAFGAIPGDILDVPRIETASAMAERSMEKLSDLRKELTYVVRTKEVMKLESQINKLIKQFSEATFTSMTPVGLPGIEPAPVDTTPEPPDYGDIPNDAEGQPDAGSYIYTGDEPDPSQPDGPESFDDGEPF